MTPLSVRQSPLHYAVGDINGRCDLLEETLGMIGGDRAGRDWLVVFLGNYMDRGRDSHGLVERLSDGSRAPISGGVLTPCPTSGTSRTATVDDGV